jgi:lysophospholipase L1-like esterase
MKSVLGLGAFLCGVLSFSALAIEAIPAFTKNAQILFQGDSITDGNRGRSADPNHILGHGYAFIVAAKFGGDFPELALNFMNRGVSGNTVLDLEKRWQKDMLDLKPDVLSVLVGVNDNARNVPLEQYEQVYDKLIADAKAAKPTIKLVLCEPFLLPVGGFKANWESASASIKKRQEIAARLAAKHGAAYVKFQAVFDEACKRAPPDYWIWDGVHPTYSGHQLMADEWERVVRAQWPAGK